MEKIERLTFPDNCRIIVISDIHGELELFKRLLEKVEFNTEDYLVINGDLCEKGRNSTEVVRFVMDLEAKKPKVHVTEGNCDTLVDNLLDEDPRLINYLLARKNTLFNEWLRVLGYELNEDSDVAEIKELLLKHYPEEINWLSELPTAIETEDYIFVHAGLENKPNWRETDRETAIAIPTFLEKEHGADQYVIVGHWPVGNYLSDIPSSNPKVDNEKRIIAIDGGNAVKTTGQLNAFIIQRSPSGDRFTNKYVDCFPTRKVTRDFDKIHTMMGAISYPNYQIAPVECGDHFTLCEQTATKQLRYIKNEYIKQDENGQMAVMNDVSCATLNVRKGDVVSIVDDSCEGYTLIKKNGRDGWIAKASLY